MCQSPEKYSSTLAHPFFKIGSYGCLLYLFADNIFFSSVVYFVHVFTDFAIPDDFIAVGYIGFLIIHIGLERIEIDESPSIKLLCRRFPCLHFEYSVPNICHSHCRAYRI